MILGGAPQCTTCSKSVYHAEQVFGPGKKIYHKPCLKCTRCNKRLDPGGLVEHDMDPYCKHCHVQQFGTRDIRHSNLRSSPVKTPSKTPSKTTIRPLPSTPSQMSPKPPTPRTLPPPTEYYTPPQLSSSVNVTPSLDRDPSTPITRPNFSDARPISVPFSGKKESFDERGLLRRNDSPRSKVGERVNMNEEFCWGCEKRVYVAEQVFALGHKWHRGCLRCEWCKSTIEPGKVSDRRGAPICKHCYSKEYGPGATFMRVG